ncbi:MAG TPA: hypothetical protein VKS79_21070 [Gemmataceae bacterium]|nr:hypothetical protein [Gemmataceae bacterium]
MFIPIREMVIGDMRDATWDFAQFPELAAGSGLTVVSGTITSTDPGLSIANSGSATVNGTKVQIRITAVALTKVGATKWLIVLSNGAEIARWVNYPVVG